ncbi:HAMP domain-containing sensor histidine kinase [Natrononativus amylolyticus]|uniref:sensor histidine kinase n=1 Tax=Natrononativus amylolyticus TaxID=2963434 RepID=UPI0031F30A0B
MILVVTSLCGGSGIGLLYAGRRLPRTSVHPSLYDRVARWCLAGLGAMVALLVFVAAVAGVTSFVENFLILTALASVAGLGIGVYDAQARTRALLAEQRSRELARQNQRLESFSEMLTHELRNPLTIAKVYHGESDPRNEGAAAEVDTALERIDEMIDVLLITIRGSTNEHGEESVVLEQVATEAWDDLSRASDSASLIVDADRAVRADSVHVYHLLRNLFENSVEHGPDGVTVRLGDLEDGFYVADDGPGLPEKNRAVVTEGGFTTKPDGIGLGLTFVEHLATGYGWEMTLTTGNDGGTRVEFTAVESADGSARARTEEHTVTTVYTGI